MADQAAINRAIRHRIILEKLTKGEIKRAQKVLKGVADDLVLRLSKEGVTITNTERYNVLLKDVRALLNTTYGKMGNTLISDMEKLAPIEAEFEVKSINLAIKSNVQAVLPSEAQLHAALFTRPIEGQFLEPLVTGWRKREVDRVTQAITTGFYRGTTTAALSREIRGTAQNNFKDGIIGGPTNNDTTTLIRTVVNHTSSQTTQAVYAANSDIVEGWRFVNTLDDRTSLICGSQNLSKVWPIGHGPVPPLHFNCRSTMVFVPKKEFQIPSPRGTTRASVGATGPTPVPAGQSYSAWLKNQPAEFQDVALGKTRGALFRRGGLTVDKFTTDTNDVLTLPELKKSYPLAFKEANIK